MTYFIIPSLLIIGIILLIIIAIKEVPPLGVMAFVLTLVVFVYLDFNTYKTETYQTNNFSTLCDDNVCILRIDGNNITFEKKIDYDLIKSNGFTLEVIEYINIFGNTINNDYKIIPKKTFK